MTNVTDTTETDATDVTEDTDATDVTDVTESTDVTEVTDVTESTDVTEVTDVTEALDGWAVVELEDDPNNPTLNPCDTGNLKSPGADIDGAELVDADESYVAALANCALTNTGSCTNDSADASNAEGAPNASGAEETGTYASLNGGVLRCAWEGDVEATIGMTIIVFEVGGLGIEQYSVRLCKNAGGDCNASSVFASGEAAFTVDSLL